MPKSRGRAGAKRQRKPLSRPRAVGSVGPVLGDSADLLHAAVKGHMTASGGLPNGPGYRTGGTAVVVAAGQPKTAGSVRSLPDRGLITGGSLGATSFNCDQLSDTTPQSLGVTYWFDTATSGEPYKVSIRLAGKWLGRTEPHDGPHEPDGDKRTSFETIRTVDGIVPGTGRTAITTRMQGLADGEWEITASATDNRHGSPTAPPPDPPVHGAVLTTKARTSFSPVVNVRAPGARLGAWPTLVMSGAAVALMTQWFLSTKTGIPSLPILVLSLIACLIGLIGAKVYYLVTHRAERPPILTAGMCLQGFVIGAIATVLIASAVAGIPVGAVLDATAPGLLFGMGIGRLGCFFGGCCVGRPSSSRWALWSSDRAIGTRRIPVQLIESSMSIAIGITAFIAVAGASPGPGGAVFLSPVAANTIGRQLLFPLRSLPRATAHGRPVTLLVSAIVLTAAVALVVL